MFARFLTWISDESYQVLMKPRHLYLRQRPDGGSLEYSKVREYTSVVSPANLTFVASLRGRDLPIISSLDGIREQTAWKYSTV